MTTRSYATLILAAWINAVFWASMPTVGWASYAPDPTGATCTVNWRKNDVVRCHYNLSKFVRDSLWNLGYISSRLVLMTVTKMCVNLVTCNSCGCPHSIRDVSYSD
ncbi:visual pigment-like receptor hypothetical protein [Limosa lapponica baueri]|uniref:Uncharacterized protein n=1 Tax=Limosa lapponica baueri TaxID=1758121 RepID=A0A2I0T5T4_LIMLA|nr:visual pigment-like receptor hypothetical protein [Limosa lapponica baueri]